MVSAALRWNQRLNEMLDRPLMLRTQAFMTLLTVVQLVASVGSLLLVQLSDQIDMRYFTTVIASGIVVPVLGLAAWSVARSDPDGRSAAARVVLVLIAVAYGLFGVGVAYIFGFWASPFTLFCVVVALIIGIVIGRQYGWVTLLVGAGATGFLEVLRVLDVVPYAPAPLNRPIDDSGTVLRSFGTAVPLVMFSALAVSLCFCMLATNDRQRAALARSHEVIRRYVPAQVADAVLERGEETTRLERRKLTIFFSDVVTFTETTDRMEPEELARVLDEYFSEMTRIAQRYDGTIDELIGDAVLIFFGAPAATNDRDHAVRALRMAVDMQEAVGRLNQRWELDGIDAVFRIRMGVNTGVVTVGNVGSGTRRKYAALGRAVNLAARIQTHCPPGGILMSRATWLLSREEVPSLPQGEVELKGVGRPTELYAVDLSATRLDE